MVERKKAGNPGARGKAHKATLSVRMDQTIINDLADDADTHRTTQAKIVQRLLEYFHKNRELQHAILSAVNMEEVPRLNKTLQLMEWGDHAYQRRLFFWAIESYSNLDKVADGLESLQRLVRSKLSLCWMFLAIQLRHQALMQEEPERRRRLYDAAIDSLCVAIGYFQVYRDEDDTARARHESYLSELYNEACSLTLAAQYSLERVATEEQLAPLRKVELENEPKPVVLLKDGVKDSEPNELANKLLHQALMRLSKLPGKDEEADGVMQGAQWLFTHAEIDPDLELLRKRSQTEFKTWIESNRSGSRWLNSYRKCRHLVRPETIHVSNLPDLADQA